MTEPGSLEKHPYVRVYDLAQARASRKNTREPLGHQLEALRKLKGWFDRPRTADTPRGGLLVLPTGGGKTFTAVRFLCEWPLSEGYKVLWLAHTHHLLEQACETFGPANGAPLRVNEVGCIREPRTSLRVRVVSGMPGHARIGSVKADDDVLIGSLQTIAGARRDDLKSLEAFLRSAGDRLVVVFDEAHHAPAPTYSRFIDGLRERHPGIALLGLTATPVYDSKLRRGWLARLFPQGIVYQTTARQLMAARVLAEPVVEQCRTRVEAAIDPVAFDRWSISYADLPAEIVESLAKNQARNDLIVRTYIDQRAKYGKTLIFADRWHQCDYISTALQRHGVRADVVYSHVDAQPGTVAARNRRTADENTKVLRAFKDGDLDVLVNVRMLTEGTDVPSVQSVFLTRQTTSKVLLTQMIGRALRGTAFGGTEKAYVVSFIDDWKQLINWAEFSLDEGPTASDLPEARTRLPVQLVSIDLLRRLAAQMYDPSAARPATFFQTLPLGWYRVQFDTQVDGGEDIEHVDRLVLVYDDSRQGFESLLGALEREDLSAFVDPLVTLASQRPQLEAWVAKHFTDPTAHLGGDLVADAFHLARHIAQAQGTRPEFYPFEERSRHNLDALVDHAYTQNLGMQQKLGFIRDEYDRPDRFWRALYGNFELFRRQVNDLFDRVEDHHQRGGQPDVPSPAQFVTHPETYTEREPSEEVKREVKERDHWTCLCCGSTDKRYLQIDHIQPLREDGQNDLNNLQTLCQRCNTDKAANTESYRSPRTLLQKPRPSLDVRLVPSGDGEPEEWARCLRGTLNVYYRCAAVSSVEIGRRKARFYEWRVVLNSGNDPRFLEPHLEKVMAQVRDRRGSRAPNAILIEGTDASGKRWATRVPADGAAVSTAV